MKILLVEDDERLSSFIERGLTEEGHSVTVRADGYDAEDQAILGTYHVIVLDIGLPGQSGTELLRHVRSAGVATPVLILSAHDQVADRVRGLDAGADDYLTKPFAFDELLARLRALHRRGDRPLAPALVCGPLRVDEVKRQAWCGNEELSLTNTEFALLAYLCAHAGTTLSRARIEQQVWGDEHDRRTNVVAVYVNYLRRKLARHGCADMLETVRGIGYRLRRDQA